MIRPAVVAAVLLAATTAVAEDGYRYGRIRYAEPDVFLQRTSETSAEDAYANLPFVPGDRVWSGNSGRAEIQFFDASLLWIDAGTKVDYFAQDGDNQSGQVVVRLWSGSLGLRAWGRRALRFVVETPNGDVEVPGAAVIRVDAGSRLTRLVVREGEASLIGQEQQVAVDEDERAAVRRGEAPEGPWRDDGDTDEFDEWMADREHADSWRAAARRYLPTDLDPYSAELEAYGTWYYEADVGNVWRPHVDADWSPYWNGRWAWTSFGWTWVEDEPWGWAPFHYGRWGYSATLGWYWAPGSLWGPAWVSWAVGRNHVGWCALDRWNRPVVRHGHRSARYGRGGHARARQAATDDGSAWLFVRRDDFGTRDVARRRVVDVTPRSPGLRLVDGSRFALSRRLTDAIAADRRPLAQPPTHPFGAENAADRFRGRALGADGRGRVLPPAAGQRGRLREWPGDRARRDQLTPHTGDRERRRPGSWFEEGASPGESGADRDRSEREPVVGRPWPGRPWPGDEGRQDEELERRNRGTSRDRGLPRGDWRPRGGGEEQLQGARLRGESENGAGERARERERVLERVFRPLSDAPRERSHDAGSAVRDRGRERTSPPEPPRARGAAPSGGGGSRPAGRSERSREQRSGAARRHP